MGPGIVNCCRAEAETGNLLTSDFYWKMICNINSGGLFFFQVCIHIYSSGAVHKAIVEVVSTCSLESLAFGANFKSMGLFLRLKKLLQE